MTAKHKMGNMGDLYDRQAQPFADRAGSLLWWETIGKPAYDKHLSRLYGRKPLSVLDLGSASGRVEQFLIERGLAQESFTGVEISPDQVAIARAKFPQATFTVGDISKISLPKNTFDLVISNMVLEFLDSDQLERTLKGVAKWLKPGGELFFITTHPCKMKATSGLKKPGVFTVQFPWGGEGPNYYRTLGDFRKALKRAGLTTKVFEEQNVPREAQRIDLREYARYTQYRYTRLVVLAHKPK
ncbi:MAG: class I SAM-dependent methyltransferase [bacterium]